MTYYIGQQTNTDLLGSETPRFFYALRRTDDGLVYFAKIDQLKDVDAIVINDQGLSENDFVDFEYGVDFFDGRLEADHSRPYTNLHWDQYRWDSKNIYYYINSDGNFVVRINQEYKNYPATMTGSIAQKTVAITGASGDGFTVTLNFATTTPFAIGSQITVTGINPTGYNGIWTVTGSTNQSVSFGSNVRTSYVSGGAINGSLLTITKATYGLLKADMTILGVGVTNGTKIIRQLSGVPGETGLYVVDTNQSVSSTEITASFA